MTTEIIRYRDVLAHSVVFEHLSPAELDLILSCGQVIDVEAGETIIQEGRRVEGFYVILEGRIKFFLPPRVAGRFKRASPVHLNELGPGRCFGEYGMIDDAASSATAEAITPSRLCFLSRVDFLRIVNQSDRLGRIVYANLLRFLVGRLRAKDSELDSILLVE